MASSRPSRVSKTTALLLNKVASGTLEEFLGEEASDFPSFVDVDDFEERKPVATKVIQREKEDFFFFFFFFFFPRLLQKRRADHVTRTRRKNLRLGLHPRKSRVLRAAAVFLTNRFLHENTLLLW